MIMFAGHSIVDLESWHSWWPWIPIRLLAWPRKIRWLYIVERRRVYSKGRVCEHTWIRDEFRDVTGVPYFETTLRDREQYA